jgi:hypothetical protein
VWDFYLTIPAESKRPAERSEVKNMPVDTFLARGRFPLFQSAVRQDCEMKENSYAPHTPFDGIFYRFYDNFMKC